MDLDNTGYIPLAAYILRFPTISSGLTWSWFRTVVAQTAELHKASRCFKSISFETIFIEISPKDKILRKNNCKIVSDSISCTDQSEIERNLSEITLVFSEITNYWPSNRHENLFRNLLLQIESEEFQDCVALFNYIEPFNLIHLINKSIDTIPNVKLRWKTKFIFFVSILFLISLSIALLAQYFKSEKDTEKNIIIKKPPPLKYSSPQKEITIKSFQGEWNKKFPIHRVNNYYDGFVFIRNEVLTNLKIDIDKSLSLLGFTKNIICKKTDISCFFTLINPLDSWDFTYDTIIKKTKFTSKIKHSGPKINSTPNWKVYLNKTNSVIQGNSPPAILSGISGKLLFETGYNPEKTNNNLFILYRKMPPPPAPKKSIWNSLTGGLVPSTLMIRIFTNQNKIIFMVIAIYKTQNEAHSAKNQILKILNKNLSEKFNLSQMKKNLILSYDGIPSLL